MGKLLIGGFCGVIGGAIGAAVWAAISYFTGFEIGWIACGIGALVGFGMALGSRGEAGIAGGVVAAVIALLSVGAGKYAAVQFSVSKLTSEVSANLHFSDDDAKAYMADQLVTERESKGETLKWPDGMTSDDAEKLADYPVVVVKDVEKRWKGMSPEAAKQYTAQAEEQAKAQMKVAFASLGQTAFERSFGLFDILWAVLAVLGAFKIGSGDGD